MINLINLTDLKNFLQFSKEKGLFDAVGKWPVLEESFKKGDSQSSVLSEEEHRASQELFVELRASLNLMKWDDNVLEKDDVFISEWNCETTNDRGKDIQKFCCTIEFVSFMNQSKETLIDSLSNHFSSWDKFGIELMKNILQVVSFDRFF